MCKSILECCLSFILSRIVLFLQLRFVGLAELASPTMFKVEISRFLKDDFKITPILAYFLENCVVRHTTNQKMNGKSILDLPPKVCFLLGFCLFVSSIILMVLVLHLFVVPRSKRL